MKKYLPSVIVLLQIFSVNVEHASATPASKQATFSTPEEAVTALVSAAKSEDVHQLEKVLGAESSPLFHSGDQVQVRGSLDAFTKMYSEKNNLEKDAENRYALIVGADEWPFPIPLVSQGSRWHFDTAAGMEEIVNRRIGQNELWAIQFAKDYVTAQKNYFSKDWDRDGFREYAQAFLSSRGRRNGLFWVRNPGDAVSPLATIIAQAFAEGYRENPTGTGTVVHGYHFKILREQGGDAPGGKKSYMTTGGRLTEGFALLAYPAVWDSSGVMSFIVNQDGQVYQKNLGDGGSRVADVMTEYNPDSSWSKVE